MTAATELVQIEKPLYGGAFMARIEGKATFVPLTLPGEQALVRIVEAKRGYAIAEAEEIVHAAPERAAPGCLHFGICGGCNYQHAQYDTQIQFKLAILRETLERVGVRAPQEIATLAAEPWRYRNRIRMAFDKTGEPGYRGRRSHAVIPICECPIAAPALVEAALGFAAMRRERVLALPVTEISLFCDAEGGAMLATISLAAAGKFRFDDIALAFRERVPGLVGLEFVVEPRGKESARTVARWGASSVTYGAAGFDYRVDHGSFFQVNRWLIDPLVERVTQGRRGKVAWDLFAGVGLFARQLSAQFERVIAVESAPSSIDALKQNLRDTCGEAVRAETLAFLRRPRSEAPDLIVVDPPRTGLGPETTAQLARTAAPAIVYVSCDPATLARDLRALAGDGYELQSIALVDLFPQTFHLETVVELRRA
jgi:23S rRNA (uracil1939-C5)-methyltransferase